MGSRSISVLVGVSKEFDLTSRPGVVELSTGRIIFEKIILRPVALPVFLNPQQTHQMKAVGQELSY